MTGAESRAAPTLAFVPYAPELEERIVDFNRRLAAGPAPEEFTLHPGPGPLLYAADEECVSEERYFALEGDAVRGGVFLQVQPFQIDGETCVVANMQLPISEGIVDRRYAYVGMWLVKQVLRRYPRCFALGMGSPDRPLPQLLRAMGWAVWSVPFFFLIANVTRAARELPAVGSPRRRRVASTLLRVTGAGALTSAAWRAAAAWRTRDVPSLVTHGVEEWDGWADQVWEQARSSVSVAAVRDACTLRALFPTKDPSFPGYRLEERGRTVGWIVLGLRQMVESPHFGSLAVGTIVDGITLPGYEVGAVRAATRLLTDRGADVVVTNQSHPVWVGACRRAGFLGTRSNYVLAPSPALLAPDVDVASHRVHFTRGDGDGRVHL